MSPVRSRRRTTQNDAAALLQELGTVLHLRRKPDGSAEVYGVLSAELVSAWLAHLNRGSTA